MNLYESIKSNLKEDDTLYNNSENMNVTDGGNLTFDDIYISCRLTGQNKGLLGVAYVKDPSDDKIYNVEVSYIDGEYGATSGLYQSERLVNLMKSIYGEHIEDFAKDVVKKEGIELKESELKEADEYDEYRAKLTEKAKTIEKLLKTYNSNAKVDVFVDPTDNERPLGRIRGGIRMNLYESIKKNLKAKERISKLNESSRRKNIIKIQESDLATYLGVTQSLLEKVNHANDDINAKIREALRSKGKAKKYADEFNKMGITIDDSPREGVELIGPNGKRLSADRLNIFGPAKPGHNDTHGGPWATNIKSKVKDLANYDKRIAEQKENIENLKNTEHDDIIRKYPNKTTEEALKAHEENIASEERSLDWNKKWRKDAQKDIEKEHNRRERGHNSELGQSRIVDRKSPAADKIDYKNYLDSKDNDINKDYTVGGNLKRTPGQQVRDELKNKKYKVHDTYYYGRDALDDIENRKIDAKAIEARRKEIEEEYKKKLDDEVNNMLKKKSDADASYKGHKEDYNKRVSELNDFRKQHNLPTKDEDSFDDYLEKRAQRYRDVN